jgi:hypothetical protein
MELRASAMALFGMLTWMYQWHRPQRDLPAEALTDHLAEIFLDGFLPGGRTRNASAPGSGKNRTRTPWAQGERPPSVLSGPAF